MEPFFIAPTEALLIGFALGDYVHIRQRQTDFTFLGTLRERLQPFVPDLKQTNGRAISPADLPTDVQWRAGENDVEDEEIGISPAFPNVRFVKNVRGVFRQYLDATRHNLYWLAIFYLGDSIGLSPEYRAFVHAQSRANPDSSQIDAQYERAVRNAGEGYSDAKPENDRPDEIDVLLTRLADFNEQSDLFLLGRYFGQMAAAIRLYEHGMPPTEFVPLFLAATTNLWQANRLQESSIATSALKTLMRLFRKEMELNVGWMLSGMMAEEGWTPPETEQEMEEIIRRMQSSKHASIPSRTEATSSQMFRDAWAAFWITFGDTLGALRNADEAMQSVEFALPSSRTFSIKDLADIDKLSAYIKHAERELNSPADRPHIPQQVIGALVCWIEPLTKRIWPNEFHKTVRDPKSGQIYKPGLKSVLNYKIKNTPLGSQEQRFSQTALGLYISYRCPVSHGIDAFECNFEEAMFVLSAVRMLMQLSDGLKRKHNP